MANIHEALSRVASGDAQAAASFGIERRYTTGLFSVQAGVYEWDQRLLLSGGGIARLVVHRSLGDAGGDATGIFQTRVDPSRIRAFAGAALASGILEFDPGHIEPGDLLIRVRIAANGSVQSANLSMDAFNGEAIEEFLAGLSSLVPVLQQNPLRTLTLTANLRTEGLKHGGRRRVPMTLGLRNDGAQGHWVRNPAAMNPDGMLERRYVTWAPIVAERSGVSQIPPAFAIGVLEPVQRSQDELLWLPPQSEVPVECSAMVNFPSAGKYYFKAGYTTYAGGTTFEDAPRWIGGAFSQAQEIAVA